jgi:hypothetical protein
VIFVSDQNWLSLSVLILLILSFYTYANRFIGIFKPSYIIQAYKQIFTGARKHGANLFSIDENMRELPIEKLGEKQREKWFNNLQNSLLFNLLCLFVSKKLRDYQRSGYNIVLYVFTVIILAIYTIISFAGINYGIYKISILQFQYLQTPDFFLFIYYSFNHFIFGTIQQIIPVSIVSQLVSMIEALFSILLITIFVSLFFSYKNQKYVNDLDIAIKDIEKEAESMESFIMVEYKANINEALAQMEKMKMNYTKFLLWLSEDIK